VQDVRDLLPELPPPALLPALEQLPAGARGVRLGEPGGQQLLREPLERLELQALRPELLLVRLLRLLEGVLPVQELEQEVLVLLQAVGPGGDRVFDDVVRPPLVPLPLDVQPGAEPDPQALASLQLAGGSGVVHVRVFRSGERRASARRGSYRARRVAG